MTAVALGSSSASAGEVILAGQTLGEALRAVAATAPGSTVTFPGTGRRLGNAELLAAARGCAAELRTRGVRKGEIVGVLSGAGPELLAGVFGAAMAGAAATVLPVPAGLRDTASQISRLARICDAAPVRHLVLGPDCGQTAGLLLGCRPGLDLIAASEHPPPRGGNLPDAEPSDLAIVQFTSGTTTRPRGVLLSHEAVLAALRAILVTARHHPGDVLVQWMPHHHDMGLFGHLSQILNGASSHAFEPMALLRHPEFLLRYLARHRATTFTGVNFAYDRLAACAIPELLDGLDLSSWRLAYIGAEPVNAATVERFARTLAPAGVGPGVMYPVYGLAEATLPVLFPEPGSVPRMISVDRDELGSSGRAVPVPAGHPRSKQLVSVGGPVAGVTVRIVGARGVSVPDGSLGELQVRGASVTGGYLNDPESTAALFDGGWLRTGDLALRLGADHFIAGRSKEMAVVNGQNYFPEDAEAVAREVPGVYRQRAVAVARAADGADGADGAVGAVGAVGAESIAVIAETALTDESARDSLREQIRLRVSAELATPRISVHLVAPRWLTRTTSGKWQRLLAASRLTEENP